MAKQGMGWRAQVRKLEADVREKDAALQDLRAKIANGAVDKAIDDGVGREAAAWKAYQEAWDNYYHNAQAAYDKVKKSGASRRGDLFREAKAEHDRAWQILVAAWKAFAMFHERALVALDQKPSPHPLDVNLARFVRAMKEKFIARADKHKGESVTERDFDWDALNLDEIVVHYEKEIQEWRDAGPAEAKRAEDVDVANMAFLDWMARLAAARPDPEPAIEVRADALTSDEPQHPPEVAALIRDAADGDPGEAGEAAVLRPPPDPAPEKPGCVCEAMVAQGQTYWTCPVDGDMTGDLPTEEE